MKWRFSKSSTGRKPAQEPQKALINEQMRFLLLKDKHRFTRQLMAQLLGEGVNLNPAVATASFYRHWNDLMCVRHGKISPSACSEGRSDESAPPSHYCFRASVMTFIDKRQASERHMALAVIDTIAALKQEWLKTAPRLLSGGSSWDRWLRDTVDEMAILHPEGNIRGHALPTINRRVRIAVITALLRHVHDSRELTATYGAVSEMLRASGRDTQLLKKLLSALRQRVPYADHIAVQSVWRALNNLDTEATPADDGRRVENGHQ
jgi:hypothetical protein